MGQVETLPRLAVGFMPFARIRIVAQRALAPVS